ncbi:hypothetical protein OA858_07970 [Pseudanabaena galeata CCNP1313]|nr:hypothetical protein [Pseudanabaena galeata]WGS74602.1 hypothetical protein OA858_07970 [Pseudanabaena galeata CCNP1313]
MSIKDNKVLIEYDGIEREITQVSSPFS